MKKSDAQQRIVTIKRMLEVSVNQAQKTANDMQDSDDAYEKGRADGRLEGLEAALIMLPLGDK